MEKYSLVGIDGNAFSIMAYCRNAMRMEGCSSEEMEKYLEDAKSSDYNHLLAVSMEVIDKLNNGMRELIGSLVAYGGDPMLVEDEEQAEELRSFIEGSTIFREVTNEEERDTVMQQLNLTSDNNVRRLYSAVNGSEAVMCFAEDWDIC